MNPSVTSAIDIYRDARISERAMDIMRQRLTAALARLSDVEFQEYINAVSDIEHELQERMRLAIAARREGVASRPTA